MSHFRIFSIHFTYDVAVKKSDVRSRWETSRHGANKLSNQNLLSLNEVDDENENSILPIKITNEKEQLLDKLKDNDLTKNVGTERYMAPEIKLTTLYNYKVDIYSAGIVLYELFEKKILLNQKNLNWYYTPKSIKNLIINNMLNENFCDRLDSLQLIGLLHKLGY